ncbi:ring-cleaving dioxygenase [Cohnella endophytica]|uniref:Ring-cleaving dioxygenase n=1 Tax=Cohnella endophytica TaxID=2419778 RepID=A0A494XS51_9BACL|nr:ring-cleaving dioxygenase [Cohnella endophytica]RKP51676.1 ring-cleaving dioxygenase [Cohnella endophytica]
MTQQTSGIHHVTAFVRHAQATVDFYAGALGLRMVKKTINFDAPEVYHLYFGNEGGRPGTIITFFPWPTSRQGRIGGGQVGITTYVVPVGALEFWKARFDKLGLKYELTTRFGEELVQLSDPDGLCLEIVEREDGPQSGWTFGGIPADKAIKGFGGAVLFSTAPARTAAVLEQVMGMRRIAQEGDFARFQATGDLGNLIDVNVEPMAPGVGGAGTVHHIAWRASDDEDHARWRSLVEENGFHPTPFIDRQYFNAIYFREEGGILFEIATDPPGFARDEPAETMGEKLMLPEWFEAHRAEIEAGLPPIQVRVLEADQQ